jgi:hypothetical protein
MINLEIAKYRPYAEITLVVGNTKVDLGMLSELQMKELRQSLYDGYFEIQKILDSYAE